VLLRGAPKTRTGPPERERERECADTRPTMANASDDLSGPREKDRLEIRWRMSGSPFAAAFDGQCARASC
jgi:hypothetical protein